VAFEDLVEELEQSHQLNRLCGYEDSNALASQLAAAERVKEHRAARLSKHMSKEEAIDRLATIGVEVR